ncbi:MAG TPA: ATP-binding protein, partial [Saprospiraceae bacterium]|nr:ATP-binding protein [Saprospiraceae bacterium]HMQ81973.1 ATP-binding protein [Saprospiraceae bacterium]
QPSSRSEGGFFMLTGTFEDRINFCNAGQLPDSLTVDSLLTDHPSIPFNPDIATTFFRAGLIEAWGRGTLKIMEECRKANLPSPVFSSDSSGFATEFKRVLEKSSGKSLEKILEMMKINRSVTIAELAEHINISTRAVEKQIANLKDENRIRRVGGTKGGHWEVIEG